MAEIKLDMKHTGISQKSIMEYKAKVENIHKDLHRRANDEKDFVGWLELPTNYDKEEFKRIKRGWGLKISELRIKVSFWAKSWMSGTSCN